MNHAGPDAGNEKVRCHYPLHIDTRYYDVNERNWDTRNWMKKKFYNDLETSKYPEKLGRVTGGVFPPVPTPNHETRNQDQTYNARNYQECLKNFRGRNGT
jgi:hypothetical protein